MRHGDKNKKFGRERNQRKALMRSLSRSLALRGKMLTTLAKAKATRPLIEKMLTRAKRGTIADRRALVAQIGAPVAKKLIERAAVYKERQGGYVRIVKMGRRLGDAAQMAIIEFV